MPKHAVLDQSSNESILRKNRDFRIISNAVLLGMFLFSSFAPAATITVDSLGDTVANDGVCTLREAIQAANTDTAVGDCIAGDSADLIYGDTIYIEALGIIDLDADLPEVNDSVSILGRGPESTQIGSFLDQSMFKLLKLNGSSSTQKNFLIKGLTLYGGADSCMSGPFNNIPCGLGGALELAGNSHATLEYVDIEDSSSSQYGGGIGVLGLAGTTVSTNSELTVRWSTISGNTAQNGGGGIYISGSSNVSIKNTTLRANQTQDGPGGGIAIFAANLNDNSLSLSHTTIYESFARGDNGGGLWGASVGANQLDVDIVNSTIVSNIIFNTNNAGAGGGVYLEGSNTTATLKNSIIANNQNSSNTADYLDDIFTPFTNPATVTSSGFNFVTTVTTVFGVGNPNSNGDYVGQGGPGLLAIGDYGGVTETSPPDPVFSRVIDKGSCNAAYDQRGFGASGTSGLRIYDHPGAAYPNADNACDIGAVEYFASSSGGSVVDGDGDFINDSNDCAPVDSSRYQLLNGYLDSDGDGLGVAPLQQVCSGSSLRMGYVTVEGDNCPTVANPGQEDADMNGTGDACEGLDDGICFPIPAQNGRIAVICL